VPLSTVALEGYDVPAPADPEALLALNYGPDWRIPDPSFKYDGSSPHRARIKGWFGSHSTFKPSWNIYWTSSSQAPKPDPSPFASWVAARIDKKSVLVDIGCGRGTDTLLLAKRGINVIGYDYSDLALGKARKATPFFSRSRVQFNRMSIADTRVTLAEGARLAATPGTKTVVARLVLDALSHEGYSNFWLLLRLATARGGDAFLEFRASTANPMKGTKSSMWRRLVDVDNVKSRLAKIGGSITEEQLVDASTANRCVHRDAPVGRTFRPAPSRSVTTA
jgi:SAM-dependent methyltransferase